MCMRKMSIYNKTLGAAALVFAFGVAGANAADGPHFGQPINPADLAPWDISIGPGGVGLLLVIHRDQKLAAGMGAGSVTLSV
jgi:hypothetical protein